MNYSINRTPHLHANALKPYKTNELSLSTGWVGQEGKALAWAGNITDHDKENVLVLLHDAGGSMRCFNDCLIELTKHRRVVTLDLPGHGSSDRRGNNAPTTVEKIGLEIAEACIELGLKNYTVAGLHLGGKIASWLVNAGHASTGATLGVSIIKASERKYWAKTYAPSLVPEFDGSHLIRAFRIARWERSFFPWFKRERSCYANDIDSSDATDIHLRALDLLRAGPSWQAAVEAEINYDLLSQCPSKANFKVYIIQNDPRSKDSSLKHLNHTTEILSQQVSDWSRPLTKLGIITEEPVVIGNTRRP